ncbi:MAG: hypothetical protein HUJ76_10255 [Parasporobacterium sp.]|nr:hypothetical protein [Parasporobacterium sp.]
MRFLICDITISCNLPSDLASEWEIFSTHSCDDDQPSDISVRWHYQPDPYYDLEFYPHSCSDHIIGQNGCMMFADAEWTHADIVGSDISNVNALLLTLFVSYASASGLMMLHSSFIDYRGHGIAFSGPSGIGKTTQAELWNKYLGAEIINGDKALIRPEDGGIMGYGSPWHGSSPYISSSSVPLRAIIFLRQSGTNAIRRVDSGTAVTELLPQILIPLWDEAAAQTVMDAIDRIVSEVPVYILECRPDEEAVLMTRDTLFTD